MFTEQTGTANPWLNFTFGDSEGWNTLALWCGDLVSFEPEPEPALITLPLPLRYPAFILGQ